MEYLSVFSIPASPLLAKPPQVSNSTDAHSNCHDSGGGDIHQAVTAALKGLEYCVRVGLPPSRTKYYPHTSLDAQIVTLIIYVL